MGISRRPARLVVLACTGALLLSSCAPDVPAVPAGAAKPVVAPVLTVDQDAQVHEEIAAVLATSTETLDVAGLAPRVTGPALALRTAELSIAAATGSTDAITELPLTVQSVVVPTTDGWPRTAFSVSERPQNLQTERLLVTEQASAREQYKLWGWVRLFPGVTLPTFPIPTVGTPEVAPDDASLLLSPLDAVAQYTDVLNAGDASAYAALFPVDPLRECMVARHATLSAAAATGAGTYSLAFAPAEGQLRALRTANGGALVVAQITSTETLALEVGATFPLNPTELALTGGVAQSNSLTTGRTAMVGIYIPPTGSPDPIAVVGSELLTTSASVP